VANGVTGPPVRLALIPVLVVAYVLLPGAPTRIDTCPTEGCIETAVTNVATGQPADGLRELQLNLCNSGQAGCYRQGRSLTEAAGLIDRYRPNVVTMNEICSNNVLDPHAPIRAAMTKAAHQAGDATAFALFTPAVDEITGMPYRCVNGDLYGIGMVGRGPAPERPTRYVYQHQWPDTDEGRVAVCATVGERYDVCTTHLESDNPATAQRQCSELMGKKGDVSAYRESTKNRPTLVGADLNLGPQARKCVAKQWHDQGDRGVQHVLWTGGFHYVATKIIHMRNTDHPALLVDLTYQPIN
jgi:hypothetical protein